MLRFLHHIAHRTADQAAAQAGNDAECTAMVAPLGNFHVRIMARRKAYALGWHKVTVGIVQPGQMRMDGFHHLVGGVRAGNGEHLRVRLFHHIALGAETAGDDHLAVFRQRFTDRIQRFLHRTVYESAGVDHHQIRVAVAG